jgi:tight adherence protein C
MLEWLVLGCVFLFVFGVSFVAVRRFSSDDHRINVRLANGDASLPPQGYQEQALLLGELTEPLGGIGSPAGDKRLALERELREAGYYSSKALLEYTALRAMLIGVPIFGCLIAAIVLDPVWLPYIVVTGVIAALLGYSVPRVYLNYLAGQRNRQIERGLPVAIDLLSLCLTGGQNVLTGLTRVAHDLDFSFPVLAQELRIVHRHADMVGLEMALQQLANRTNVQEVKNLSVILTHTERLGTDLSTALLEFSTNFRQTLRQRAEEQANRVSFWMLFPTIFCLLLPALVLFNAPLCYEFAKARKELGENYNKGMQSLNELKKENLLNK